MISLIVFSKNRTLQLDLCLASLKNLKISHKVTVIYVAGSPKIEAGYNLLRTRFPQHTFIQQSSRLDDHIIGTLSADNLKCCMFMTDDSFFYRESLTNDLDLEDHREEDYVGFSYRMGLNITKRDFGNGVQVPVPVPEILYNYKKHIGWNWRTSEGYWGYPLSVDGHLFSTHNILKIISENRSQLDIITPNDFEAWMQQFTKWEMPENLSSERISTLINSPNNRVQNEYQNRNGDSFPLDCLSMNELYLKGKRIDPDYFKDLVVECPHTELNLLEGL